jgi:hypothetical protein
MEAKKVFERAGNQAEVVFVDTSTGSEDLTQFLSQAGTCAEKVKTKKRPSFFIRSSDRLGKVEA